MVAVPCPKWLRNQLMIFFITGRVWASKELHIVILIIRFIVLSSRLLKQIAGLVLFGFLVCS